MQDFGCGEAIKGAIPLKDAKTGTAKQYRFFI